MLTTNECFYNKDEKRLEIDSSQLNHHPNSIFGKILMIRSSHTQFVMSFKFKSNIRHDITNELEVEIWVPYCNPDMHPKMKKDYFEPTKNVKSLHILND